MKLPKSVHLVEVGPRDGLQGSPHYIEPVDKIRLIDQLSDCGFKTVEATSFVSPEWIPQLRDHAEVFQGIHKNPDIRYPVLVPNQKGFETALAAGVKTIALFTATSDAFTQKNINCTVAESFKRFEPVVKLAHQHQIDIRAYISTVIACPYAGETKPTAVAEVAKQFQALGCYEISLGDTTGVGTSETIQPMIESVASVIPMEQLAGHYHDTHTHALDNIRTSLSMGMTTFDSSVAGLGGCPYAKSAKGNVATEAVVQLMDSLGISTGIDLEKLMQVVVFIETF